MGVKDCDVWNRYNRHLLPEMDVDDDDDDGDFTVKIIVLVTLLSKQIVLSELAQWATLENRFSDVFCKVFN